VLALAAAVTACAAAAPANAVTPAQNADSRYTLANGCYALYSKSAGKFVVKTGGGYAATAGDTGTAERIRMQATTLGEYVLYGKDADYVTAAGGGVAPAASPFSGVVADPVHEEAPQPSEWRVEVVGDAYKITSVPSGQALSVAPGTGALVTGGSGDAALFYFEATDGCKQYPEADVNATGTPGGGPTAYNQVQGLVDAHLHMMAFEFIGGSIRCGRPWHRFGIPFAMVDCPDHGPGGVGGVAEGVLSYGNPVAPHDTVGWPTFKDWPAYRSLTHEGVYYKGMERAWRGGLRLFVNLMVDNEALCKVYPLKRNECNEMNTVRLEIRRIRELERYIDAQNGGPGKGWFRIVTDPWQARSVINQGKLAVVLGMEVSQPFDCDVYNDQPACDRKIILDWINELYSAGVRQMELVNKFDNALVGVAGDSGTTGNVTSVGNRSETGNFFDYDDCKDENSDRTPATQAPDHNTDQLIELYQLYAPGGALPVYGEGAQCNKRGLTDLGEFTIREMMKRRMLFDPDHMSVLGRRQSLAVTESASYSGVVSSHSWSTDDAYPRVYRAGGFNAPYAGSSEGFVREWKKVRAMRSSRFFFGFGYGADMNGFGGQGPPRGADAKNPVKYPFKSFDGRVTLDKARWGERVWDVNTDGVAMYGLYPDWLEDLRMLGGDEIVRDMANAAEAYLQTWERADGIRDPGCRSVHEGFTSKQLGRVFLGHSPEQVLRSTNQPVSRPLRAYRWCIGDKGDRTGDLVAVFTNAGRVGLVATTAYNHQYDGVGPGDRAKRLRGKAKSSGSGLYVRRLKNGARIVYGVKGGKVRFVALAAAGVAKSRKELLTELRLARLR
jgi:microsomal dipeptidase-like Zn-dependent dipeptidase